MNNTSKEDLLRSISLYCKYKISRDMCDEGQCEFCHVNSTYNEIYDDLHTIDMEVE